MSRVGKYPVPIPADVKTEVSGNVITVKGPKGELTRTFRTEITIRQDGGQLIVERPSDAPSVPFVSTSTDVITNA